jgi:hypothetical protein
LAIGILDEFLWLISLFHIFSKRRALHEKVKDTVEEEADDDEENKTSHDSSGSPSPVTGEGIIWNQFLGFVI